ncbi:MAG: glycosyltransferase family 4 protein, partial [Candidatus Binatia bacterium]
PEKGVSTLLEAWRSLKDVPLKVAGDGPLSEKARAMMSREKLENVELLGQRSHDEVVTLMKGAHFLVFPSEWYEGFPMTLVEALACGVPIVASRLGAMAEIVEERHTGLLFQPGDSADLADKVRWAMDHPDTMRQMGVKARRIYEEKYTAERNYETLSDVYERAVEKAKHGRQLHDAAGS